MDVESGIQSGEYVPSDFQGSSAFNSFPGSIIRICLKFLEIYSQKVVLIVLGIAKDKFTSSWG